MKTLMWQTVSQIKIKERRQINEIRNEKGGGTNDASVIKGSLESIINNYVNKLDKI